MSTRKTTKTKTDKHLTLFSDCACGKKYNITKKTMLTTMEFSKESDCTRMKTEFETKMKKKKEDCCGSEVIHSLFLSGCVLNDTLF